jgi:uncharacterized membrane protein YphA (DoxX/SURF4 family)
MVMRNRLICAVATLCFASAALACGCFYQYWYWSSLQLVHRAIESYEAEHGDYPRDSADASWDSQLVNSDHFNEYDSYSQSFRILDRWGSPFVMIPPNSPENSGAEVILRSSGPNCVDDHGGGDDLRFENNVILCNDGFHWKAGWPQARFRTAFLGATFLFLVLPIMPMVGVMRRHPVSVFVVYASLGYIFVHRSWFAPGHYPYGRPPYDFYAGILVLGVFGFHFIRWRVRLARSRKRADTGHCPECGYPSEGLPSDRCPECGSSVPIPAPGAIP